MSFSSSCRLLFSMWVMVFSYPLLGDNPFEQDQHSFDDSNSSPVVTQQSADHRLPLSTDPDVANTSVRSAEYDSGFSVYKTDHFVMYFNDQGLWTQSVGQLLENTLSHFIDRLSQAGFSLDEQPESLSWVMFQDENDYHAYARDNDLTNPWTAAYYSTRTNRVVVNNSQQARQMSPSVEIETAEIVDNNMQTLFHSNSTDHDDYQLTQTSYFIEKLRHEASHQLAYNLGIQKRGVMYPVWVSEGLATCFEFETNAADDNRSANPARYHDLLQAVKHNKLMPISEFIVMTHIPSEDRESAPVLYAQSWAFWQFLFERRSTQLKQYLEKTRNIGMGYRSIHQLRHEFTSAFGPMNPLEQSWRAYLNEMTAVHIDSE